MSAKLPRVLFSTSEIPQSINAGSMQLFRVLQGYPGDHLLVMGPAPAPGAQLLPCRYEQVDLLTNRLARTRWRDWLIGLNALNTAWEPQLARSLSLAREFRPDLVVTVMDKLSYFKHAWALAARLQVPFMTITMDNPHTFEHAHRFFHGTVDRLLSRIYADAALSVGVSREMAADIDVRFGKPTRAFAFGPPAGIVHRTPEASARLMHPGRLTLGYAGSLGLGYEEGIKALLPALERTDTQLFLYTRDQHVVMQHPLVHNRGGHPPEELWGLVQAECDALVQPYAREGRMLAVYRTHFPTKISEYCWVGMPILVTGPSDATGIRWAREHPQAAAAAASDDEVVQALESLRRDPERRRSMAQSAAAIARTDFDPEQIRHEFVALLGAAAARGAKTEEQR